jgi:hypothetical protein
MQLTQRSIDWLQESVKRKTADKITVVGEIGVFLIQQERADLIEQAGTLRGDGLEVSSEQFTFASHSYQGRLIYPLAAVEALYTRYRCKFASVHSVYEDEEGQPVVVLKDVLLGN